MPFLRVNCRGPGVVARVSFPQSLCDRRLQHRHLVLQPGHLGLHQGIRIVGVLQVVLQLLGEVQEVYHTDKCPHCTLADAM